MITSYLRRRSRLCFENTCIQSPLWQFSLEICPRSLRLEKQKSYLRDMGQLEGAISRYEPAQTIENTEKPAAELICQWPY